MINKTRVFLTLLLLLPLIATISSISRPVSAAGAAQWTPLNMPTEGTAGKWTLAGGSDIRCLTMAGDGTLYCYANPSGTSYTLFKSTDAGRSWTAAGKVTDVIVDIAVSPQDNTNIYYATASRVFKSVDAGNVFTAITGIPGGAGAGNVSITSLDIVHFGNANLVAVSTVDADTAQFGGVYLLDESQNGNTWVNANIGNLDVYRAAFSPNYSNDRQIVAIASDETNTFVSSKIVNSNWGQTLGTARINAIVPAAASIAFPDGYNGTAGNAVLFAGIDTGANGGDVFQVTQAAAPAASAVKDLKIGSRNGLNSIDVGSLAVSGSTIFAGCARSAWVYLSTDGGAS